jgi:DNA-binding response OmpR family regulator
MARILVVNDEADLVEICELVLEEVGHEVDTLTEGRLAAELAKRTQPELIVLDWQMKSTTGGEVFRQLRSEPATAQIPVLLISAIPDGQLLARMYGMDGYLQKPFVGNSLVEAVDGLLRSSKTATGSTDGGRR